MSLFGTPSRTRPSSLDVLLAEMTDRLEEPELARHDVITWSSPVPSFGDLMHSQVATVGLNPSSREFMDSQGRELHGSTRRLHTLTSLGLQAWHEAEGKHLQSVWDACCTYFFRNPYDTWFRSLDQVISGTGCSYYDERRPACHLDLIPYATTSKWTQLPTRTRAGLMSRSGDTLGLLLRDSSVRLIVLNGQSVVAGLERLAGVTFVRRKMPEWTLPRNSGSGIAGVSYSGVVTQVGGVSLGRSVHVLGYNHNIQSSFGVTAEIKLAIRAWVTQQSREAFR